MAFTSDNGTGMYMPVAPMGNYYGGNGGFGNGFGGDGAWWVIILLLFAMGGNRWGNGFGGGNGGYGGGGGDVVAIGNLGYGYRDAVQQGFDQQAVMSGINGINSAVVTGFGNTATALCNGFAGVNANMNAGFNNAETANNARQMANMQQSFNLQSQLAQCCCENRLATERLNSTILSENCSDRQTFSDGVTQLLIQQNANTQRLVDTTTSAVQGVYDKLCQLELNAKDDKIADLQHRLTMADLATSQTAQTAALENYLNPPVRPAYIVQNPNCCVQNPYTRTYNGCACSAS